jgi:hypothetical protein
VSDRWKVVYFRDAKGHEPVKEFFGQPSSIGITRGEAKMFQQRLAWIRQRGIELMRERKDVLEPLVGEKNLYSLRILRTTNNPRVLLCAVSGRPNYLVLLHAFKEKGRKDYKKAIETAKARRDLLISWKE